MTQTAAHRRALPLVVFVCAAPLLAEALGAVLDGIANVRRLAPGTSDLEGLLRSLAPDGIIVDSDEAARAAESFADESDAPLVRVLLRGEGLRVRLGGSWEDSPKNGSAEAVRNVLVEAIFGRRGAW